MLNYLKKELINYFYKTKNELIVLVNGLGLVPFFVSGFILAACCILGMTFFSNTCSCCGCNSTENYNGNAFLDISCFVFENNNHCLFYIKDENCFCHCFELWCCCGRKWKFFLIILLKCWWIYKVKENWKIKITVDCKFFIKSFSFFINHLWDFVLLWLQF